MTHQFLAKICCLGLLAAGEVRAEPVQIDPAKPPQAIETARLEFRTVRQADLTLDPLKHRVSLGTTSNNERCGPLRVPSGQRIVSNRAYGINLPTIG